MGFNKGIYWITGYSIMLQMAEKKNPSNTGWFLLTKSYNDMLVSVMFLSQECNLN